MVQAVRALELGRVSWALVYAPFDAPLTEFMEAMRRVHPGIACAGCTSHLGTFTAQGFGPQIVVLAGRLEDGVECLPALRDCRESNARQIAASVCREFRNRFGGKPNMLLLHATPGFEERILEGVAEVFGPGVPVFGGSAADNDIRGGWKVFSEVGVSSQGFVLTALQSARPIQGGFLGGYLPTEHSGTVTRASGRIVYEIDGRPAAAVYNLWSQGAIEAQLTAGGSVLAETTLMPLGKDITSSGSMPRRLLAHPAEVSASDGAMTLFTEFGAGDQVTLMTSTPGNLVGRIGRVVQRTLGAGAAHPKAGLFLYCGGTLSVTQHLANQISKSFQEVAPNVPFVGLATLGEQGSFFAGSGNHHGNLMCVAVLFG